MFITGRPWYQELNPREMLSDEALPSVTAAVSSFMICRWLHATVSHVRTKKVHHSCWGDDVILSDCGGYLIERDLIQSKQAPVQHHMPERKWAEGDFRMRRCPVLHIISGHNTQNYEWTRYIWTSEAHVLASSHNFNYLKGKRKVRSLRSCDRGQHRTKKEVTRSQ